MSGRGPLLTLRAFVAQNGPLDRFVRFANRSSRFKAADSGWVAEWFKAAVLKAAVSNPRQSLAIPFNLNISPLLRISIPPHPF